MTQPTPFQPIGDRARWQLVYDELCRLDVGDVITYDRLYEVLDLHTREAVRGPLYHAARVWGLERFRALVPVRNEGYRVAEASEHEGIARGQHRKSRRALKRGVTAMRTTDRTRLTPEQRKRFDQIELTLTRHEDMIRRIDVRSAATEKAVADVGQRQSATEEQVSRLQDTLRRHGIEVEGE